MSIQVLFQKAHFCGCVIIIQKFQFSYEFYDSYEDNIIKINVCSTLETIKKSKKKNNNK